MPETIEDLGRKVKAKYPGQYDDLGNAELGSRVKAKYPADYGDFADIPRVPGMEKLGGYAPGMPKPPEPKLPEELAPEYDPTFKKDFKFMAGPMSGVYGAVRGVERMAGPAKAIVTKAMFPQAGPVSEADTREAAGATHDILGGAMQAATPFVAATGVTAPIRTGLTIGAGMLAQTGVAEGLKALDLPPEYANVVGDVAGLVVGAKALNAAERVRLKSLLEYRWNVVGGGAKGALEAARSPKTAGEAGLVYLERAAGGPGVIGPTLTAVRALKGAYRGATEQIAANRALEAEAAAKTAGQPAPGTWTGTPPAPQEGPAPRPLSPQEQQLAFLARSQPLGRPAAAPPPVRPGWTGAPPAPAPIETPVLSPQEQQQLFIQRSRPLGPQGQIAEPPAAPPSIDVETLNSFAQSLAGKKFDKLGPEQQALVLDIANRALNPTAATPAPARPVTAGPSAALPPEVPTQGPRTIQEAIERDMAARRAAQAAPPVAPQPTPAAALEPTPAPPSAEPARAVTPEVAELSEALKKAGFQSIPETAAKTEGLRATEEAYAKTLHDAGIKADHLGDAVRDDNAWANAYRLVKASEGEQFGAITSLEGRQRIVDRMRKLEQAAPAEAATAETPAAEDAGRQMAIGDLNMTSVHDPTWHPESAAFRAASKYADKAAAPATPGWKTAFDSFHSAYMDEIAQRRGPREFKPQLPASPAAGRTPFEINEVAKQFQDTGIAAADLQKLKPPQWKELGIGPADVKRVIQRLETLEKARPFMEGLKAGEAAPAQP